MKSFDIIIIGAGVVSSAAAYYLAHFLLRFLYLIVNFIYYVVLL
jgi:thioredoxin reductase